jgi:maleylacetoacetate isomerase
MKLHGYFRSSASYRVRIALNLKGLDYEQASIHLVKNGGEQFSKEFQLINPESLVPALVDQYEGEEIALSQSLAIMEYLEEQYPQVNLLPKNFADRAYVRGIALSIACDIHPLNNLRVLKQLVTSFSATEEQKTAWYQHWCTLGLGALEKRLAADKRKGDFCFGNKPTIADCCLIPQIFNAQRFNCDLSEMPIIMSINQRCLELDAFRNAAPMNQADAE